MTQTHLTQLPQQLITAEVLLRNEEVPVAGIKFTPANEALFKDLLAQAVNESITVFNLDLSATAVIRKAGFLAGQISILKYLLSLEQNS